VKQPILTRGRSRQSGLIDTISAGYAAVNRLPWLLLAPILLDLLLWFGPRLSPGALVAGALAVPGLDTEMDAASRQMLDESRQATIDVAGGANLLALLSVPIARAGVPSALALLGGGGLGGEQMLGSWPDALAVTLAALGAGLVWGGLYRAGMALQVRQESASLHRLAREGLIGAGRSALLIGLMLGVAVLAAIPAALLITVVGLLSPALASLLLVILAGLALWAEVYLFFAPDAIFVRRVGPLRAIRDSVVVVRRAFWSALGFIVLTTVILAGMAQVWLLLAGRGPGGMVLAILGNAYVASGLAAAAQVFYRDRLPAEARAAPGD